VKPPNLSPWSERRLRDAVADARGKDLLTAYATRTTERQLRREHPAWSDGQVQLAAMLTLARRYGITW
jgi:hypothetical protein